MAVKRRSKIGPKYKVPLKRRRSQKTNYYRRKKLLLSRRTRLVIRPSNKHMIVQFINAKTEGDETLAHAHSRELREFKWINSPTSNLPAAYLTGYLAGKKALAAGVEAAILDSGLINTKHYGSRFYSALKGVVDAGVDIPHNAAIFPSDERVAGKHIAEFGALLSEDKEAYKKRFSGYGRRKPENIEKYFADTRKEITTAFAVKEE
ncbi:MAG: 50S ribosomal protein L18 [Candidatus Heimdallarchaeota archaeon]|nr:50S ribosomal protein L18 [Candidatus Heimdallarchaeota archaeon]MCK5049281.1 50S ribosomal protein L18 [Candidatus Heimdallarchaeota archaeon]